MAGISVGIDLCQSPLRMAWITRGTVLFEEGSKGIDLHNGEKFSAGESHSVGENYIVGEDHSAGKGGFPFGIGAKMADHLDEISRRAFLPLPHPSHTLQELVDSFIDTRNIAKSSFGSPMIKQAVVVVPNSTNINHRSLEDAGNRAFVPVREIVPEYVAVAAAYAHKKKLIEAARITIVSFTAGFCDVCVVSVNPQARGSYEFTLEHRDNSHILAKDGEKPKIFSQFVEVLGMITGNDVLVEASPMTTAIEFEVMKELEKKKADFDEVVFIGKSQEVEDMRLVVRAGLSHVKEWKDIDDTLQAAAYGAAVLAAIEI